MRKAKYGAIAGLLMVALGAAACSGSPSASHGTTTTNATPSPPTTDLTASAGATYLTAFNTMSTGVNADIPTQNGSDPTAATNAINNEVTLLQTFDSAIQAIQFPSADQADIQAVLNADTALETALGTLAVNTGDVANYNSIFATVQPDQTAATAAQDALGRDVGLTFSSSGS